MSTHKKFDPVTLPEHYQLGNGKEVLDYILIITDALPPEVSYALGNAIKYLGRAPRKGNAIQDLSKGIYYSRDAETRLGTAIQTRSYKKHLKGIDIKELVKDIEFLAEAVSKTYPAESQPLVEEALLVWKDYFEAVTKVKGPFRRVNYQGELAYAVRDWIMLLADIRGVAYLA